MAVEILYNVIRLTNGDNTPVAAAIKDSDGVPVYGSNQADFEFRRLHGGYPHPLITGIGGIVVYSSTPQKH